MVDKWLKAAVLEDGALSRSDTGTPQGGVTSRTLPAHILRGARDRPDLAKPLGRKLRAQADLHNSPERLR